MQTKQFEQYDLIHKVSPDGVVVQDTPCRIIDPYESSNGLLYQPFTFDDGSSCWKRLDIIVALTYAPISDDIISLPLTVNHINGVSSDNNVENLMWIEDTEEWRAIKLPGLKSEGYFISSWGRVKNSDKGVLHGTYRNGYKSITLRTDAGSRCQVFIHRIVAEMFIGPLEDKFVNHIDGDKDNNRWDNLEIVTRGVNNKHAIMTGLRQVKLTDDIASHIRELLVMFNGSPKKVIDRMYEMGFENITESMVRICKEKMISEGVEFDIRWKRKIDDTLCSQIKGLLIEHDGDTNKVFDVISVSHPDVSIYNIKSIKTRMNEEGYSFTNRTHNRKITEKERVLLIDILRNNGKSPSTAMTVIVNIPQLKHVTIHDLKYLKRKYL